MRNSISTRRVDSHQPGVSGGSPPETCPDGSHPERAAAWACGWHPSGMLRMGDRCPGVSSRFALLDPRLIAGNPPGCSGSRPFQTGSQPKPCGQWLAGTGHRPVGAGYQPAALGAPGTLSPVDAVWCRSSAASCRRERPGWPFHPDPAAWFRTGGARCRGRAARRRLRTEMAAKERTVHKRKSRHCPVPLSSLRSFAANPKAAERPSTRSHFTACNRSHRALNSLIQR